MKGDRRAQMLAAALTGALAAIALSPAPAAAASRICRQLEAELAGASRAASPTQIGKYDSAIERQRGEIAKARGQARNLGCGFALFSSNAGQCASLNAALSRMNGNLDKLERQRTALGKGGSRRSRASVLALLDKNGCRKAEDKVVTIRSSDGSVQRLLGETIERADRPNEILPRGGGQYRTLCVRTCDGYFFPMSNAASVSDFERDQTNCESSCPGADIQVYYSRGMDGDPAGMVSVATGQSYDKLSTAYLYKKPDASVPQSCGCNAPRDFSVLGGASSATAPPSKAIQTISPSISIMPSARPDPAADPETQANAEGGLDIETIRRLAAEKAAESSDKDRKVRVVGPKFLPDPSAAIDLQAPAPTKAP